ncbi:hypothetical protein [Streptomyces sp. NBC_00347]|uniref:hypothetical protein n=1 Tax=Streptomyces sp. NBC_00347 TaxID=2975721 RepID=UPI0022599E95|nr:hypothetical protein [Streptomyces sp. NBC_00347]MCX5126799.1 hypothetical protein [Streptomyces sp. NBC_00347]
MASGVAEMSMLNPTGTAEAGDIAPLVDEKADFGAAKPQLQPEAYRLAVGTKAEIVRRRRGKGDYYGSPHSLPQTAVASPDRSSLPVGTAVG